MNCPGTHTWVIGRLTPLSSDSSFGGEREWVTFRAGGVGAGSSEMLVLQLRGQCRARERDSEPFTQRWKLKPKEHLQSQGREKAGEQARGAPVFREQVGKGVRDGTLLTAGSFSASACVCNPAACFPPDWRMQGCTSYNIIHFVAVCLPDTRATCTEMHHLLCRRRLYWQQRRVLIVSTEKLIKKMLSKVRFFILLSFKKKWSSDRGYTMDAPYKHFAKLNKPDTKGQMLWDSGWMGFLEWPSSQRQKVGGWSLGVSGRAPWGWCLTTQNFTLGRWAGSGEGRRSWSCNIGTDLCYWSAGVKMVCMVILGEWKNTIIFFNFYVIYILP